ncbi:MAG: oxidoreductase [Zetaproteobacteria bacterium]|nr:oxidoreductase [Pseudobdellovibrionaceae bacterium]
MGAIPRSRQVLSILSPGNATLRTEPIPQLQPGQALLKTIVSNVSAGTELLFFQGEIPKGTVVDTSLTHLNQNIKYPLVYGYSNVAEVIAVAPDCDEIKVGTRFFSFKEHADYHVTNVNDLIPCPPDLTSDAMSFLPNMETAISIVMDTKPIFGERGLVIGQGVLGSLVTWVLGQTGVSHLHTLDINQFRRKKSILMGAKSSSDNLLLSDHRKYDFVIELSKNPQMLNTAIEALFEGGRIVVGSWYGKRQVNLDLGGRFHRDRISIVSSQVSSMDPTLTPRFSKKRRIEMTIDNLKKLDPNLLITHRVNFSESSMIYSWLSQCPSECMQVMITYS